VTGVARQWIKRWEWRRVVVRGDLELFLLNTGDDEKLCQSFLQPVTFAQTSAAAFARVS
jgi:hypothetical protein